MESSLSDGLDLFGLFGASRTTRARQGTSRAGPAGGSAHGKLAFRWAGPFRFIRRQPNHESPSGHESGRACRGRARPGTSRAGPAGEEPARARVGQGLREEEMLSLMIVVGAFAGKKLDVKAVLVYW